MTGPALEAERIVRSLERLSTRVRERFPESSLYQVSQQLLEVGSQAKARSEWLSRPILPLRVGSALLALLLIGGLVWALLGLGFPEEPLTLETFVTLLEAGINDIIFLAAGIFFLVTIETRIKRRRALKALHDLRVLAHIIDMHQLHKDPERVLERGELTPSTPRIELTPFELSRYLDYCSELLSLEGKIAALYAQFSDDSVVVNAVSDVESLTNGISRKIWQKLIILHSLDVASA